MADAWNPRFQEPTLPRRRKSPLSRFRPLLETLEDRTVPADFMNTNPINLPVGNDAAALYPSNINVTGMVGNITDVNVTLTNISHTWPGDVDILLVSPTGQKLMLMSDVGGSNSISNVTLTFDDSAASSLTGAAFGSGTFKASNVADGDGTDTFPAPAPVGPYGSALSVFNGFNANGTWSLYVRDDVSAFDGGGIAGGWKLSVLTGAPPANNDNFVNAFTLTGSSDSDVGTNIGFTGEAGEPTHSGAINSAWWTWTAPSSGLVVVDTEGSNYDTYLAIYTGNAVNALTFVTADDDGGSGLLSKATFTAVAGTTYRIAVDGFSSSTGNINLNLNMVVGPPNDNFANAFILTGTNDTDTGTNVNATSEAGEPPQSGTIHSVWWDWTAPTNGNFELNTIGSNYDTYLSVFTGPAVNSLTTLGQNDDFYGLQSKVAFTAVAGTTYHIAVDGFSGNQGNITLNLIALNTPPTSTLDKTSVTVNEGSLATNGGTYNDVDGNTVMISATVGSIMQTGTSTGSWAWTYTPDDGPTETQTVVITFDDGNGGMSTQNFQLNVDNVAPTATFGNNGPVNEGSIGTVSFTGQFDPSNADTTAGFRYAYDLDNNGLFDDGMGDGTYGGSVVSSTANLPASFTEDGPDTRTVRAWIIDKDGNATEYFTTVTIVNVAPTITAFDAVAGVNGNIAVACNPVTFDISLTDVSPVDLVNPFTYEINWGDGSPTEFVTGGTMITVTHSFDNTGTFTPMVRASDKDAPGNNNPGAWFAGPTLSVVAIQIIDGNLVVAGTNSNDSISINTSTVANVRVTRNGVTTSGYDLSGGGRVIVRGCDGNDVIAVNGAVSAEVFGGNGNDYLYGGTGQDMLWGEAGNDYISLGNGHDIGIGGLGRDLLYGGSGDDILLGGDLDPLAWDWTTLQGYSSDWSSYVGAAGTGPASLGDLANAAADPADTNNYDRFWGNTGKDAYLYRSSGAVVDQVNGYSLAERDYLLALP